MKRHVFLFPLVILLMLCGSLWYLPAPYEWLPTICQAHPTTSSGRHQFIATVVNWEVLSHIAGCVSAICAVVALVGVALIYWQLHDSRRWNKLHFTFTFMPQPFELGSIENDIDNLMQFWKRNANDPLRPHEVNALLGNTLSPGDQAALMAQYHMSSWTHDDFIKWEDVGRKFKLYLNLIERYCVAINTGVADSETTKSIYGFKFKQHFEKAKPYISEVRKVKDDDSIYSELEAVIDRWYPKLVEKTKKKY